MANIFISYTSSDRDWAFWIGKELEALGDRPHIHEWEIQPGQNIYGWMEQQLDAAHHILCVVSDAYLDREKASYSALERDAGLWRMAGKKPGFVRLVVVKPCKLPALSDHFRRCELFGIPEDAARQRFRDFMQKRGAPETSLFPGKTFAITNIPIRVPEHFLGRDDALAAIEKGLHRYEGRIAITALNGLRGVGKTTLAAAYAERHREDYRATWWIRAQTADGMRADLVGLGVKLQWVAAEEKEEPALIKVMERLKHEGDGILLIYDNAIDAASLKPFLPQGGKAKVLVTSNFHAWRGLAEPIEIRLWPKEIGADYLVARTGRETERAAAEALSNLLGGLPLAHEQAAAYCERLGISLADYAKRFETTPARFLDDAKHAPADYHDGLTVAKTFALAIEEAAKLHPAAEPLITHAAFLAPDPVPLFLFGEGREAFGEPLASALADDGLDEAIAALRAFALVDHLTIADERDSSIVTDSIRLHRLVRMVARTQRSAQKTFIYDRLIAAMAKAYPESAYNDPNSWPKCRRLDTHAVVLLTDATEQRVGSELLIATLSNRLGNFRQGALGAYAEAEPLFDRTLAIRERVLGLEHPDVAWSLCNLASLRQAQGNFASARILLERALTIDENALGPLHNLTAATLSRLADVLYELGDLDNAQLYAQKALDVRQQVLGSEHPSVAGCMNVLARIVQARGDLIRARALLENAAAIREKMLARDHPEIATNLNDLGMLLLEEGDTLGARNLLERAFAIDEKTLGREHPNTARTMANYASVLAADGEPTQALALGDAAVAAYEKSFGPDHPLTRKAKEIKTTIQAASQTQIEATPADFQGSAPSNPT